MQDAQRDSLVSIIIPCYNAERWLRESIDSCLRQTYRPLEIIVIDDGSTDNSLQILKSYGAQLKYETGSNRGGNHARNRGFAISKGEFIQFLDADDYLLPEKLERQVNFLHRTNADVVYGDWRFQFHLPNGLNYLGEIVKPNQQEDVLMSLLARWWVMNSALLFRRSAVVRSGGWDESIQAGQDKDFFISVAMTGARIEYQPGCFSVYRKYGSVTVSTSNLLRFLQNHSLILQKVEKNLANSGKLSIAYKKALASGYFYYARKYHQLDQGAYSELLSRALELDPGFKPVGESLAYRVIQSVCDYDLTEKFYTSKKLIKSAFKRMPVFETYQRLTARKRYYYHKYLKPEAG